MVTHVTLARHQALVELLSRADAVDLRRGHRIVLEGCPDRDAQLPRLASAYVQARLLELREREEMRAAYPDVRHDEIY